jgi:beta-RFAP synthase
VGLAGFEQGGLLVDAGLRDSDRIGALACRVTLPPEWRVVLFTPSAGPAGLSGPAEEQAFLRLGSMPLATTERLCRLVLSEMLPAAAQSDLPAFGEAVYEYGRGAGEFFATVQGGTFADARVSEVVGWLRAAGVAGVGQSSWGPTVFALVGDEGAARELLERWRLSRLGFRLECDVRVTSPRDRGATVSITSAPEHARPVS